MEMCVHMSEDVFVAENWSYDITSYTFFLNHYLETNYV